VAVVKYYMLVQLVRENAIAGKLTDLRNFDEGSN
jgi:hypothetical protein